MIGADDRPIGGLAVRVVRLDISQTTERFVGETEANGQARIEEVRVAEDSLYRVEVTYKGAPFRSRLFQMTDGMCVLLEVRVFPTTSDASRIRSGVQFGVEAVENDLARVVQIHQVVVEGEEAFWPAAPLKIGGPEGSHGMVLLEDRVNIDLDFKEGAPFATARAAAAGRGGRHVDRLPDGPRGVGDDALDDAVPGGDGAGGDAVAGEDQQGGAVG